MNNHIYYKLSWVDGKLWKHYKWHSSVRRSVAGQAPSVFYEFTHNQNRRYWLSFRFSRYVSGKDETIPIPDPPPLLLPNLTFLYETDRFKTHSEYRKLSVFRGDIGRKVCSKWSYFCLCPWLTVSSLHRNSTLCLWITVGSLNKTTLCAWITIGWLHGTTVLCAPGLL